MNYIHKNMNAVLHESGYSNDNSIFLSLGKDKFFFTDSRYALSAKDELDSDIELKIVDKNLFKDAVDFISKSNVGSLDIDPYEFNINEYMLLSDANICMSLKPHLSFIKRIVKSDKEIAILKTAAQIGATAFESFSKYLSSGKAYGLSDKELHYKATEILSDYGKYGLSFNPIIAINSEASKPHATVNNIILKEGDLLLFDAGVVYKNYCSDRTRTAEVENGMNYGNIKSKFSDAKRQKIYDIVLKAHDEAISKAKAGMKGCEIDAIARGVIEKAGYAKEFAHGTGHGVGLDIHEFPVINKTSQDIIEENMVFTIEPGIYLEGEFGVRIEDNVVVKNGKMEIL